MSEIKINSLSKVIKKKTILDNISYQFNSGKIYGLYGRNGSGKTMLLRAISGLIFPTEGEIYIDDKLMHKDIGFPPSVGIIIENSGLLPQYDGFTNLKILSKIKQMASDDDIRKAIEQVGLDPMSKAKVKTYSLGMRQKLSIAQAIFEKPKLLLLDEPSNALDEESINNLRNLLIKLRDQGTTIIIASHNKEDIEILSDYKIKMVDGKMIVEE